MSKYCRKHHVPRPNCHNFTITSRKSELRKACLDHMVKKGLNTLPPLEWMDKILERDFSDFEPKEGDSAEILAKKQTDKAGCLAFFDFYVDKMIPTCAGTKMWHVGVRHKEPMSTSLLPNSNGQLRVSAATEGLTGLLYHNGRDKWIAMYHFNVKNPGKTAPRWRNKEPEKNTEFRARYSEPFSGQNPFGGWSQEGRKLYGKLGRMVKTARTDHPERCLEVENDCVQRLFAQNKEYHDKIALSKKRKAKGLANEDDEPDEDLEWV